VKITAFPGTERLLGYYHKRMGIAWKYLFVFVCLTRLYTAQFQTQRTGFSKAFLTSDTARNFADHEQW
jgi:hypothetical protein